MRETVSFVIPCYRSEKTISGVVDEIRETMEGLKRYAYEIILVNDCSPDQTFSVIRRLCRENDNITGVDLAKNFGQHVLHFWKKPWKTKDTKWCLSRSLCWMHGFA